MFKHETQIYRDFAPKLKLFSSRRNFGWLALGLLGPCALTAKCTYAAYPNVFIKAIRAVKTKKNGDRPCGTVYTSHNLRYQTNLSKEICPKPGAARIRKMAAGAYRDDTNCDQLNTCFDVYRFSVRFLIFVRKLSLDNRKHTCACSPLFLQV